MLALQGDQNAVIRYVDEPRPPDRTQERRNPTRSILTSLLAELASNDLLALTGINNTALERLKRETKVPPREKPQDRTFSRAEQFGD